MRDRQTRPQRLQGNVVSGVGAVATLFFLLLRFSTRAALRLFSKEETDWWMVRRQASRSGLLQSKMAGLHMFYSSRSRDTPGVPGVRFMLIHYSNKSK